jgi:hypothetical protein
LVGFVSPRYYRVRGVWRGLGRGVGLTLGLALASLAIPAWLPFAASLRVRVGFSLAYPGGLLAGGFHTRAERTALTRRLRRY